MDKKEDYDDYMEVKNNVVPFHDDEIDNIQELDYLKVTDKFRDSVKQDVFDKMDRQIKLTKGLKKIACFALIIGVVGVIAATNGNVGARYMDFIRDYLTGGFTQYEGYDIDEGQDIVGFEMTYIPEGFEKYEKWKFDNNHIAVKYYIKDDMSILFNYSRNEDSKYIVDNENLKLYSLLLDNGIKCECYEGINEKTLVWDYEDYICQLTVINCGNDWKNVLINVASGIIPVTK